MKRLIKTLTIMSIVIILTDSFALGAAGDVNNDGNTDLKDVIVSLQVNVGLTPAGVTIGGDVNNDGRIGQEETIYILQVVAQLRGDGAPAPFTGIVARHNYWRAMVGSPKLTWSSQVAEFAQAWANQLTESCELIVHSGSQYGENIAWGWMMTPEQVTDMWAEEKANYVYQAFTAAQMNVAHYTQIVWKNTTQIGCGVAICLNGSEIWVCDYSPAGNFIGQFPY